MRKRSPRASRCLWRWGVVALALFGYFGTTIGFPLPQHVAKGGKPFPCQHHACGCQSAEECWDHCCCYTAEQKLSWARANDVTPPATLVAEVGQAHDSACHGARHCCAHADPHANPHTVAVVALKETQQNSAAPAELTFVLGSLMRHCKSLPNLWVASGAALPPPAIVRWEFSWNLIGPVAIDSDLCVVSDLSPPVPPPRV